MSSYSVQIQGVPKKRLISECCSVWSTAKFIMNLEFSFLIHLTIGIHLFLPSTETFLMDIREPRRISHLTSSSKKFPLVLHDDNISQAHKRIVNNGTQVQWISQANKIFDTFFMTFEKGINCRKCQHTNTSWDWAGPSSAQARIQLYFNFLHHQNLTCNGWDITKNIIASHGIFGRLAGGLAR